MVRTFTLAITFFLLTALFLLGTVSHSAPLNSPQPSQDSILAQSTEITPIEGAAIKKGGSFDSLVVVDINSKSRADTIKIVKHNFNHREQIITGSVVMLCLAMILVTMNNYNPR